jgi:hypothetical protein
MEAALSSLNRWKGRRRAAFWRTLGFPNLVLARQSQEARTAAGGVTSFIASRMLSLAITGPLAKSNRPLKYVSPCRPAMPPKKAMPQSRRVAPRFNFFWLGNGENINSAPERRGRTQPKPNIAEEALLTVCGVWGRLLAGEREKHNEPIQQHIEEDSARDPAHSRQAIHGVCGL